MRFSVILIAQALLLAKPSLQCGLTRTVVQFPEPTWLENIYATRHGSLLTGMFGVPELHIIDPFKNTSSLLYSFPRVTSVFGITESVPDTFAVVVGNFSYTTLVSETGSYSVWGIDLTNSSASPHVYKIADIPEGQLLNGMAAVNDHTLLIADSYAGVVRRLDVRNGKHNVAIDHPSMKPVEGASLHLGINGVKVHDEYLYYTHTVQGTINRVQIDCDGKPIGPFETIAKDLGVLDDFEVTDDGTVFVAEPFANVVQRVELDGTVKTVVGNLNSTVVAGPLSVTLGRTWRDRDVAYVSTNGGLASPVNGTFIEGGKIVAVKIH